MEANERHSCIDKSTATGCRSGSAARFTRYPVGRCRRLARRAVVVTFFALAWVLILGLAAAEADVSWQVQPAPFPAGADDGFLSDVSCSSNYACTAVGGDIVGSSGAAFADRWDGTSWSLQSVVNPPNTLGGFAGLDAVSCTGTAACIAVGRSSTAGGQTALAERWDGTNWSVEPAGATTDLTSVSCTYVTACTAIAYNAGAVRWDGKTWSPEQTYFGSQGTIGAVSCSSGTSCTAVGETGGGAAAEQWNGTTWSTQTVQQPANAGSSPTLLAVSCTSSNACTAVGYYLKYFKTIGTSPEMLALVERWDGERWSLQSVPVPPGATRGAYESVSLAGVSCVSDKSCTAVGDANYPVSISGIGDGDLLEAIAEQWDGTRWSPQTLPRLPGADATLLNSVSCTASAFCMAAGSSATFSASGCPCLPLVEQSSGTEPLSPVPSGKARLTGVPAACVRAPFTMRVTGTEISSVQWLLDGKHVRGRVVHRGTKYVTSIRLPSGSDRHRLTVKVRFIAASHTSARTIQRDVFACRTGRPAVRKSQ